MAAAYELNHPEKIASEHAPGHANATQQELNGRAECSHLRQPMPILAKLERQ